MDKVAAHTAWRVCDVDDWIATFGEEEITLIFDQARDEMQKDRDCSFLRAFEMVKARWSTPVPDAEKTHLDMMKRARQLNEEGWSRG